MSFFWLELGPQQKAPFWLGPKKQKTKRGANSGEVFWDLFVALEAFPLETPICLSNSVLHGFCAVKESSIPILGSMPAHPFTSSLVPKELIPHDTHGDSLGKWPTQSCAKHTFKLAQFVDIQI